MKNGLLKSLAIFTVATTLAGCQTGNPNPTDNTTEPPVITEPTEETVYLVAPGIIIDTNLLLQIIPSADVKTVEKTTGYEVSINGETQELSKDELSLQLEIDAGDDAIQVRAVGGENTQSKNVAVITVTEEQKEHIAYNHISEMLNGSIIAKLNEKTSSVTEIEKILAVYLEGNNLMCDVLYAVDGYLGYTFLQKIELKDVLNDNYENMIELYNDIKEDNLLESISDFTAGNIQTPSESLTGLLDHGYLNGNNKLATQTEIAGYVNDGWNISILHDSRTSLEESSAGYQGLDGYIRTFTTSYLLLEKEGQEDIVLKVSYKVTADRSITRANFAEALENGTIDSEDIIVENENISVFENASIYSNAKAQYEGKEIEMNEPTIINLKSTESVTDTTRTKHFYIPDLELEL